MTYIVPPRPAARSRSPVRPEPFASAAAADTVVAHLDHETAAGGRWRRGRVAMAWRATFASASLTTK